MCQETGLTRGKYVVRQLARDGLRSTKGYHEYQVQKVDNSDTNSAHAGVAVPAALCYSLHMECVGASIFGKRVGVASLPHVDENRKFVSEGFQITGFRTSLERLFSGLLRHVWTQTA